MQKYFLQSNVSKCCWITSCNITVRGCKLPLFIWGNLQLNCTNYNVTCASFTWTIGLEVKFPSAKEHQSLGNSGTCIYSTAPSKPTLVKANQTDRFKQLQEPDPGWTSMIHSYVPCFYFLFHILPSTHNFPTMLPIFSPHARRLWFLQKRIPCYLGSPVAKDSDLWQPQHQVTNCRDCNTGSILETVDLATSPPSTDPWGVNICVSTVTSSETYFHFDPCPYHLYIGWFMWEQSWLYPLKQSSEGTNRVVTVWSDVINQYYQWIKSSLACSRFRSHQPWSLLNLH